MTSMGPSWPPGWYPDGLGAQRWWTGTEWDRSSAPEGTDRSVLAVLGHCGIFMLYVVGPLIIRQTAGKNSEFVRRHATEGLNAQITFAVVWNAFGAWDILTSHGGPPTWRALGMLAAAIWILVTSFIGARRAWNGRAWRYPGSIRLVPGGFPSRRTRTD